MFLATYSVVVDVLILSGCRDFCKCTIKATTKPNILRTVELFPGISPVVRAKKGYLVLVNVLHIWLVLIVPFDLHPVGYHRLELVAS